MRPRRPKLTKGPFISANKTGARELKSRQPPGKGNDLSDGRCRGDSATCFGEVTLELDLVMRLLGQMRERQELRTLRYRLFGLARNSQRSSGRLRGKVSPGFDFDIKSHLETSPAACEPSGDFSSASPRERIGHCKRMRFRSSPEAAQETRFDAQRAKSRCTSVSPLGGIHQCRS